MLNTTGRGWGLFSAVMIRQKKKMVAKMGYISPTPFRPTPPQPHPYICMINVKVLSSETVGQISMYFYRIVALMTLKQDPSSHQNP